MWPWRAALLWLTFPLGGHGLGGAAAITLPDDGRPGLGRIVLDLPEGITAMAEQTGDRVSIRFLGGTATGRPGPSPPATRNLLSSVAVDHGLELTVAHGALLQATGLSDQLVLDLLDPVSLPNAPGAHRPTLPWPRPRPAEARSTAVAMSVVPSAASLAPLATRAPGPVLAPAMALAPAPGAGADRMAPPEPAELPARPMEMAPQTPLGLVATSSATTLSLPFSVGTGAASFKRGDWSYVVFDERRPIDLSRQGDNPLFAQATVRLLPDATLLRFKGNPGAELSLAHDGADWRLMEGGERPRGFNPRLVEGGVMLPAPDVGRVVAIPDPDGGGVLLVGTLRQVGVATPVMRRANAFVLWPTWLGVVVEPTLDTIQMRAAPDGFLLTAGVGHSLALSESFVPADPTGAAGAFTRQFDLPALPTETLLRRMRDATQAASAAPAQSRADRRLAVAQSLLALGMGVEAQAAAAAAARDDPRASARPDLIAIAAAAALLAGRVGEGEGIMDARLIETDEVAFWRGLRLAMMGQDAHAAALALAPRVGLLAAYPGPIRERLVALVGETLAVGGQGAALAKLDAALPDERRLALAMAMTADAGAPSLAGLDILAQGLDRRMRARAAELAVELRLSRGLVDATRAAGTLERLLYAWREDGPEIALRERVAELRSQGGAPRPALALLRETGGVWPDHASRLRARMAAMLEAAVAPDARPGMSPLAFVALVEENADLLPEGAAGERLAEMLADRLAALDLPERAVATLGKLAATAPPGALRATFGARLASMRLARNDAPAALLALRDSDAPGLPTALRETREFVRAQAQIAQNDRSAALVTLAPLVGPAASALRATLLEQAQDWSGAGHALDGALDAFPPGGPLDPTQAKLLLRAASDAARANDEVKLGRLREQFRDRIPGVELAGLFGVLTAAPARELSDLDRVSREVALARRLPRQLDAMALRTPAAR